MREKAVLKRLKVGMIIGVLIGKSTLPWKSGGDGGRYRRVARRIRKEAMWGGVASRLKMSTH